MKLELQQAAFRAEIIAQDDETPPSSLGMAIYRDGYRGRLLAALETSFDRTLQWVGGEAFSAAACHYIIANPPRGWTLDEYGAGFPALLRTLFAQDPEVEELAWLEWQMQRAFAAIDGPLLNHQALAECGFSDLDWDRVRFAPCEGVAARWIGTDCTGLWAALGDGGQGAPAAILAEPEYLVVWRSGHSPHYRAASRAEGRALECLIAGRPLGEVAALAPAEMLAPWLAQWLGDGLFASAQLGDQPDGNQYPASDRPGQPMLRAG